MALGARSQFGRLERDPCTDKAGQHHVRKARPVRAEAMRAAPATKVTLSDL
jgi:hypothetical protein